VIGNGGDNGHSAGRLEREIGHAGLAGLRQA
jgi:hypothetical protein